MVRICNVNAKVSDFLKMAFLSYRVIPIFSTV